MINKKFAKPESYVVQILNCVRLVNDNLPMELTIKEIRPSSTKTREPTLRTLVIFL